MEITLNLIIEIENRKKNKKKLRVNWELSLITDDYDGCYSIGGFYYSKNRLPFNKTHTQFTLTIHAYFFIRIQFIRILRLRFASPLLTISKNIPPEAYLTTLLTKNFGLFNFGH